VLDRRRDLERLKRGRLRRPDLERERLREDLRGDLRGDRPRPGGERGRERFVGEGEGFFMTTSIGDHDASRRFGFTF